MCRSSTFRTFALLFLNTLICARALAADDWKPIQRRLPPVGKEISEAERNQLQQRLKEVQERLNKFAASPRGENLAEYLPDVQCYTKAVRFALDHDEFYKPGDAKKAFAALNVADERLAALQSGKRPWESQRGLVVRGFHSAVDDSIQPYGLLIPEKLDLSKPVPLYVWLHGRGETTTDLHFIHERQSRPGEIKPDNAIVLHPFGRQCLGWKSTAEVDVLEAIEAVNRQYKIDEDRIALMGFSMGGAGAWQIGAHYTDRWAAVHAGAGFVDVARYTRLDRSKYPPIYEQKLWGVSDVPTYARNLLNVPLVAYSGEMDKQKDAADFMAEVLETHGHTLTHLVGPGMGHKYHPEVLQEIMSRVATAVEEGRNTEPTKITLQTRTLRYNRMHWLEVLALDEHWRDSWVDVTYTGEDRATVHTKNVAALRLNFPKPVTNLRIDGVSLKYSTLPAVFEKQNGQWIEGGSDSPSGLRKVHGLQGPIDDVLMAPFLVVVPTGKSKHPEVQKWVEFELKHFQDRWRGVLRGDLRTKKDTEVTAADIEQYHLILWGDVDSNELIGKIKGELPITWSEKEIRVGENSYPAAQHVPLLICPNPLAPEKYVVLNSGPTHREAHDRSNALQNPKLPDWAVVDVSTPPDDEKPGRVVAADFFNEQWQLEK